MTIITKKRLIAAGVLSALIAGNMAMAADVPAGVQLAEKQTLVRNSGAEPQSLDPNKIEGVPEANISRDLFEGLLNTSPKDGHPIPGVAESWDNKDFKVWTFHLRKDAKWSNGEPVTAQDFVYSWQRLVDPKTASPYASYPQYGHIVNVDEIIDGKKAPSELGVKAIDDHTLEVTLSEPVPYFYKLLVNPAMSPVYKPAIEKFGEKWTQPGNIVTNGAYTLKDWVVNERIVMERNPHYWDNAKTVINTVTWLPTSSEVTYVNRYRSGELDMTYNQQTHHHRIHFAAEITGERTVQRAEDHRHQRRHHPDHQRNAPADRHAHQQIAPGGVGSEVVAGGHIRGIGHHAPVGIEVGERRYHRREGNEQRNKHQHNQAGHRGAVMHKAATRVLPEATPLHFQLLTEVFQRLAIFLT